MNYIENIELGENITAPAMVYVSTADGKLYKAVATDTAKGAQGWLLVSGSTGNNRQVHHGTEAIEWPGAPLTAGATLYLSDTAGAISTSPGTNEQIVGFATGGALFQVNIAPFASAGGGGGSVATDAIFDAKGDLPVGTGSDTAAKLSAGSDGKTIYCDAAQATGLRWGASVITPSTITSDQDNYAPTGFLAAQIVRLSGDLRMNAITSFSATFDGDRKTLLNVGTYPIYFPSQHPDGTAANRLKLSGEFVLYPSSSCELLYDGTESRWLIIGKENIDMRHKTMYYTWCAASSTASTQQDVVSAAFNSGAATTGSAATSTRPGGGLASTVSLSNGAAYYSPSKSNPAGFGYYGTSMASYGSSLTIPTLSDGTETFTVSNELCPAPIGTTLAPNNSIGIRYSHGVNSGKWQGFSRDNAGAESVVDLGITVSANVQYYLEVFLNKDNTEARFYVDNVYLGRVSANMPSAGAFAARTIIGKSVGTTFRTMYVHSLQAKATFP